MTNRKQKLIDEIKDVDIWREIRQLGKNRVETGRIRVFPIDKVNGNDRTNEIISCLPIKPTKRKPQKMKDLKF